MTSDLSREQGQAEVYAIAEKQQAAVRYTAVQLLCANICVKNVELILEIGFCWQAEH